MYTSVEVDPKDGFKTIDEPEGCTQAFSLIEANSFEWIDSPGLNDPRMPIGTWINALKAEEIKAKKINLCILLMI